VDHHRPALNRLPRWLPPALAVVPVIALCALFAWPLITLISRTVRPGTIADAMATPGLASIVWYTAWQAALSTALTLAVALPPTWLIARISTRWRGPVLAAVTVPFLLPTVVVGAAFAALLPPQLTGTTIAVVLAHVFFNVAVVVRVVGGLWSRLPHDLTAAAAVLGASSRTVFRTVTWPLLRPAVIAAAGIVFAFCFTSFGVVKVIGDPARPTLEVEIARRATQLGDVGVAAVLSVMQLVAIVAVIVVAQWFSRSGTHTFTGDSARRRPRQHERRAVIALAAGSLVAMTAPLVTMVVRSVHGRSGWTLAGWRALLDPADDRPGLGPAVDVGTAVFLSLRSAAVACVVAAVVGGLAVLAASSTSRAGRYLDAALMLPLATSAVTVGLGLLITFSRPPLDWRAEWWFVPLGQALVAVPFVVRSLLAPMRAVGPDLRDAAATLGASPLRAWAEVDLRIMWRPLLAATAFAAAISLGEFGATSVLSRSGQPTMPIAIAGLLARTGEVPRAQGFALATVLMLLVAVLVVMADPAARRDEEVPRVAHH
jgi:thiamine transport system permease protein